MRLQGKVALRDRQRPGIGRAIVERFAREGADVVVNYRSGPAMAEEVVQVARAAGVRATAIQADVAQVGEVRRLVEQAVAEMGRLDILVNNAGVETHAPFWDVAEADYDKVLGVNLKGRSSPRRRWYGICGRRDGRAGSSTSARSTRSCRFRISPPTARRKAA